MKKLTGLLVIIISLSISSQSQTWLQIQKVSGGKDSIKLSDISRIYFTTLVTGGIPCPGTPTVTYGAQTYNTVLIGNQCWLKENLNVGTKISANQNAINNFQVEKYCYNNNSAYCDTFGALYQWNEAMDYSTTAGAQGICPSGWHIPTKVEFETLCATVNNNSNALKSIGEGTGSGAGTNTTGFSALIAGYHYPSGGFVHLDYNAYFWTSTKWSSESSYYLFMYATNSFPYILNNDNVNGQSVRCLKN